MEQLRLEAAGPRRCPLCGGENDCGMAQGRRMCWCYVVAIPAEVLNRVPPEAKGVVCICEACATGRRSPAESVGKRGD